MRRVRVEVTAEDIARGLRVDSTSCPIAHALHRVGFPLARVYPDLLVGYWLASGDFEFPLSQAASRFGLRFDAGRPVTPATFLLKGPDR